MWFKKLRAVGSHTLLLFLGLDVLWNHSIAPGRLDQLRVAEV